MHDIPTWFWAVAALAAVPKLFYIFQVGRRKKGYLKFRVRRFVVNMSFYIGGIVVLIHLGYRPLEALVFGFVLGLAAGFYFVPRPVRSRLIPADIKRAVIERDLGGIPFDSRIHQIDHIVPYSKGGDHSMANLRVISKTQNLRRGAKMPRIRELI